MQEAADFSLNKYLPLLTTCPLSFEHRKTPVFEMPSFPGHTAEKQTSDSSKPDLIEPGSNVVLEHIAKQRQSSPMLPDHIPF